MTYKRVIPRDFFNESKLLKCLGAFEIAVVDKACLGLPFITSLSSELLFMIDQSNSDGSLCCCSYFVTLNGENVRLFIPYNSKSNYPLYGEYQDEIYQVFDEDGNFIWSK